MLPFHSAMTIRRPDSPVYLALGASSSRPAACPGAALVAGTADWPAPDEHVVEPETYQEMIDGRVLELTPAEPLHADQQFDIRYRDRASGPARAAELLHADQQFDIAYVLRAHVADGYVGSTELLTRVSEHNDFATDACIRKQGTDERGHRYLNSITLIAIHGPTQCCKRRCRLRCLLTYFMYAPWAPRLRLASLVSHNQCDFV